MNNFSERLPATSCSPSPATVSLCPWPCTGLSSHMVNWMRKLNPWKKVNVYSYKCVSYMFPIYLSILSFLGVFCLLLLVTFIFSGGPGLPFSLLPSQDNTARETQEE